MTRIMALSVVLTLTVTGSLLSQQERQGARRPRQPQQAAFQQVFTLRGIEFTQEQQAKADEIRKNYMPRLIELQGRQGRILTEEQRGRLGEALRAAREAGKRGRGET